MEYDEYEDLDYDAFDLEEIPRERPRDAKIDEAKAALMEDLFDANPREVFYGRQVEVLFEDRFFHWITARALAELAGEGVVNSGPIPLPGGIEGKFYCSRKNRYWKRQVVDLGNLISRFSAPEFTRALGLHAETLFDAALPRADFMPKAKDVREYKGRKWERTEHDLDRIFERDGIGYGTEIKNALSYIDRGELTVKLEMCKELELRPLFIMRMAPKTYIHRIIKAGGYALIFKWQLYPFGYEGFAGEVHKRLGVPVDCPRAIEEGTVQRLSNWHARTLGRAE